MIIFFFILIFLSLFPVLTGIIGSAMGVRLQEIGIFFGPSIYRTMFRGIKIKIGSVPFGSYTKFDEEALNKLPLIRKTALLLAPSVVFFSLGMILGASNWNIPEKIAAIVKYMFLGAVHPKGIGAEVLRNLQTTCWENPLKGIGIIFMTFSIVNLLPFPGTNGAQLIKELVTYKNKFKESCFYRKADSILVWISVGINLILIIGWSLSLWYSAK